MFCVGLGIERFSLRFSGLTCLRLLGSNEEEPGNNLREEGVSATVDCCSNGDKRRPAQISSAKMPVVTRRERRRHLIRNDVHGHSHLALELKQG